MISKTAWKIVASHRKLIGNSVCSLYARCVKAIIIFLLKNAWGANCAALIVLVPLLVTSHNDKLITARHSPWKITQKLQKKIILIYTHSKSVHLNKSVWRTEQNHYMQTGFKLCIGRAIGSQYSQISNHMTEIQGNRHHLRWTRWKQNGCWQPPMKQLYKHKHVRRQHHVHFCKYLSASPGLTRERWIKDSRNPEYYYTPCEIPILLGWKSNQFGLTMIHLVYTRQLSI